MPDTDELIAERARYRRAHGLAPTDMGELIFLPPLIRRLRKEVPDGSMHEQLLLE